MASFVCLLEHEPSLPSVMVDAPAVSGHSFPDGRRNTHRFSVAPVHGVAGVLAGEHNPVVRR